MLVENATGLAERYADAKAQDVKVWSLWRHVIAKFKAQTCAFLEPIIDARAKIDGVQRVAAKE